MTLRAGPQKFPRKPPLWAAHTGAVDPRYRFMWRRPVILLPFLEHHLPAGAGQAKLLWDFASRQLWTIEGSNTVEFDEVGMFVEFPNGSHEIFATDEDYFDIPAFEAWTLAWVFKIDTAQTSTAQPIRSGNNLIIFDGNELWIRADGVDIIGPDATTALPYEEWVSVVVAYDGSVCRVYHDGRLMAEAAGTFDAWRDIWTFGARFSTQDFIGGLAFLGWWRGAAWGVNEASLFHQDPWGGFRMDSMTELFVEGEAPAEIQPSAIRSPVIFVVST